MSIKIVLGEQAGKQLYLSGDFSNGNFDVKQLFIPNPGAPPPSTFALASSIIKPKSWLKALPAANEFEFDPATAGPAEIAVEFTYVAGTPIFGRQFQLAGSATVKAKLTIKIPGGGDAMRIVVQVCGRILVDSTAGNFTSAPLCYELEFVASVPKLTVGLPNFGVRLPSIELPWTLTDLLPFPPRWPAMSFDLPPIGGRISFRSIEIRHAAGQTAVIVQGLVIAGTRDSIEADVEMLFKDGELDKDNSLIKLIRPNFDVFKPHFEFAESCLMIASTGKQLNQALSWLAPELDELALSADVTWTVRLHWSDATLTKLEELRVDVDIPANSGKLILPGLEFKLEKKRFLSLVFQQLGSATREFWVGVNVAKPDSAEIKIPVAWARELSRELLKSEGKPMPIGLELTAKNDMTLVVMRQKEGVRFPEFLKKATPPLKSLDIKKPDESCPATSATIDKIEVGDFTIKPTGDFSNFKFPFLEGKNAVSQFLKITNAKFEDADYGTHTIKVSFDLEVILGELVLKTKFAAALDWETLKLDVDHNDGVDIFVSERPAKKELFGLSWNFEIKDLAKPCFKLITKDSNYKLVQTPNTTLVLSFDKATAKDSAIEFEVNNFCLGPRGVSLDASVRNTPAKLQALETEFRFTEGILQIRDNSIAGFTIGGSGPLPPALVGPAVASIRLQFYQRDDHSLALKEADARLQGNSLLKCDSTRFQFAVTAIGLKFVEESGRYHLFFTVSGTARFVLQSGDNPQGALAWLPAIEMQMIDCPLTTDVSVLAKHINFLIPLPKPVVFPFLGCFEFELRAIGFSPQDVAFHKPTPAMLLSGQVKFSDTGADAVDVRVDFHTLHIGLPRPGRFIPQLYLKGLGVSMSVGSAFTLGGSVDFIEEGTDLGGGVTGEGFSGTGELQIQGLPRLTAGFAFLRVKRHEAEEPLRAWFIYIEASRFSFEIPVIKVSLREVGLGFGYRMTLAMIKSVDEVDDPRELLRVLKQQARSQGELSKFQSWRVDLEDPGDDPRWTIALRALISQATAAASPMDWNKEREQILQNLFLIDAVAAVRSDLTILMVARAWFLTNYHDFTYDLPTGLREKPLLAGFVILSPRKKRLLANLSSNPDAEFGKNSLVFPLIKEAVRSARFSATLLVEPGLMHYELGWPNQLQWKGNLGPLQAEFRGGMIYRLSRTEFVVGQSFLARGSLQFSAGVDLGFVGARVSATAVVAYGARYIGVISFEDIGGKSAFYGGAGIEIHVTVSVEFWIEIDLLFGSITLRFGFSFAVNFTASVEVGILLDQFPGLRGSATLALNVMGHDLHFSIKIGLHEDAVNLAFERTKKFLNVGLESSEVEAIPGTGGQVQRVLPNGSHHALAGAIKPIPFLAPVAEESAGETESVALFAPAPDGGDLMKDCLASEHDGDPAFVTPSYRVLLARVGDFAYFLLVPGAAILEGEGSLQEKRGTWRERGFLPVPPSVDPTIDFKLKWNAPADVTQADKDGKFSKSVTDDFEWDIRGWKERYNQFNKLTTTDNYPQGSNPTGKETEVKLGEYLSLAYVFQGTGPDDKVDDWSHIKPIGDPLPMPPEEDELQDERVQQPSESAFEAAVRGAVDQFTAAPYFKQAPIEYDESLREAFDNKTTLYSPDGKVPAGNQKPGFTPIHLRLQQIHQTRSTVLQTIFADFQGFVAEAKKNPTADLELGDCLARRLGLVMRMKLNGDPQADLRALVEKLNGATLNQRNKPDADKPINGQERPVRVFNPPEFSFAITAPRFTNVVHLAHESSIGIDWRLEWEHSPPSAPLIQAKARTILKDKKVHSIVLDNVGRGYDPMYPPIILIEPAYPNKPAATATITKDGITKDGTLIESAITIGAGGPDYAEAPRVTITPPSRRPNEMDPEQQLDHYVVRRRWLDGSNADREFGPLRPTTVLHRQPIVDSQGNVIRTRIKRLRSRLQFIDHFDDEPAEALVALPPEGKRYAYTITPVDSAGTPSPRPLTIVVRRYPATPPPVIPGAELLIDYPAVIPPPPPDSKKPKAHYPAPPKVHLVWAPPSETSQGPSVAIAKLRLVFRADEAVPVGQYAQDGEAGGPRSQGLPTSNARALPTDRIHLIPLTDQPGEFIDPETNLLHYWITLDETELREVLGQDFPEQGTAWKPKGWRVYVQTVSANQIPSALVPVNLRIRFLPEGESLPPSQAAAEERRPPTIEWLPNPIALNLMPPRDTEGEVGFVQVPMPPKDSVTKLTPGALGDFKLHPGRRRCLEMHWNQVPSPYAPDPYPVPPDTQQYPRHLHAGFELYEFDADAEASDELNAPATEKTFAEWAARVQLRRVQEFELMPNEGLLLTPDSTIDTVAWEAWYPSSVKRRTTLGLKVTPQFSNWYSWRESKLIWPKPPADWLTNRRRLHPVLATLLEAVQGGASSTTPKADSVQELQIDIAPVPATPLDLAEFMRATSDQTDPYGWSILQRLGLSVTFSLRDELGNPKRASWVHERINEAVETLVPNEFKPHLHVELLYQPAKAIQRASDESKLNGKSNDADDMLAAVQVSLRPFAKPFASYSSVPIDFGPATAVKLHFDLQGKQQATVIVHADVAFRPQTLDDKLKTIRVVAPSSGKAELLIRVHSPDTLPKITPVWETSSGDGKVGEEVPKSAEDPQSSLFTFESKDIKPLISESWRDLKTYVDALQPVEAPPGARLTLPDELPNDDAPVPGADLLRWLDRFFVHGPSQANPTAPSFWLATAYLRSTPRLAIAPDQLTGVLKYYHTIEDQYAHAYRYFLRPIGRYDQLWLSVGQSRLLHRTETGEIDRNKIKANLHALRTFVPPPAGGLDLVLPRIRPVRAPMILFSGRLDGQIDETTRRPPPPGKTWQIVLAQHSEQALVERNRTLARRLAYRQQSVTLVRRFQFPECNRDYATIAFSVAEPIYDAEHRLDLLVDAAPVTLDLGANNNVEGLMGVLQERLGATAVTIFKTDRDGKTVVFLLIHVTPQIELNRVHNVTGKSTPLLVRPKPADPADPMLPEKPAIPLRFEPAKQWTTESNDELRTVDLPARLGDFGQGAIVYQWRRLPYYYEHLVLAVAQASDVVSDVSSIVQRDFEYVSPRPRAVMQAHQSNGKRARHIFIRLENFFSCLPAGVENDWPDEQPVTSYPDEPRPYCALADVAVVYQFVLSRPGGVIQAISQIFSDEGEYKARNFGVQLGDASVTSAVKSRIPWGFNAKSGKPSESYLLTELAAGPAETVRRSISSRHAIDNGLVPSAGKLSSPEPGQPFANTATLLLAQRLTKDELDQLDAILAAPFDAAFRLQAKRFLDRVNALHEKVETILDKPQGKLPKIPAEFQWQIVDSSGKKVLTFAGFQPSTEELTKWKEWANDPALDQSALAKILEEINRVEENPPDVREESSVHVDELSEVAIKAEYVVIDPTGRTVAWAFADPSKPLTTGQAQVLVGKADDRDRPGWKNIAAAAATITGLLDAVQKPIVLMFDLAEPPPAITDALLKEALIFDTEGGKNRLTWREPGLRAEHLTILNGWLGQNDLGPTFKEAIKLLLAHLDQLTLLTFGFNSTDTAPQVPDLLKERLKFPAAGRMTWRLGALSDPQLAALKVLIEGTTGSVKETLARLMPIAGLYAVQVPILEADWRPRPADFAKAGAKKAGFARGLLEYKDLMTPDEEEQLRKKACKQDIDRVIVRQLHNDSLRAGFGGAQLQIIAFRGSADAQFEPIKPMLLLGEL